MKTSKEQKLRLLKAKIAVALQDETGKVPSKEKIEEVFLLARVMYKAVLGLHYKRKEQKKQGQLSPIPSFRHCECRRENPCIGHC